jgi:hypothetical protein
MKGNQPRTGRRRRSACLLFDAVRMSHAKFIFSSITRVIIRNSIATGNKMVNLGI